jgi:hypothetical protein
MKEKDLITEATALLTYLEARDLDRLEACAVMGTAITSLTLHVLESELLTRDGSLTTCAH